MGHGRGVETGQTSPESNGRTRAVFAEDEEERERRDHTIIRELALALVRQKVEIKERPSARLRQADEEKPGPASGSVFRGRAFGARVAYKTQPSPLLLAGASGAGGSREPSSNFIEQVLSEKVEIKTHPSSGPLAEQAAGQEQHVGAFIDRNTLAGKLHELRERPTSDLAAPTAGSVFQQHTLGERIPIRAHPSSALEEQE